MPKDKTPTDLPSKDPSSNEQSQFRITQEAILPSSIKQRHLVTSPTQIGDLYYGGGNSFVNLPIGTSGKFLSVVSGVPKWSSLPASTPIGFPSGFGVYLTAALTITNGVDTKIPFDTKEFDLGTEFDAVTNFRFKSIAGGYYLFNANLLVQFASANAIVMKVFKNGSAVKYDYSNATGGSLSLTASVETYLHLAVNDYVEFFVRQDSGGSITAQVGAQQTYAMGQQFNKV